MNCQNNKILLITNPNFTGNLIDILKSGEIWIVESKENDLLLQETFKILDRITAQQITSYKECPYEQLVELIDDHYDVPPEIIKIA